MKPRQLKPITGSTVLHGDGGCDFLADPRKRADQAPVFWRVEDLASIIILTAATAKTASPAISISDLPDEIIRRDAQDGAHIMVRGDAINHQLFIFGHPSRSTPLAALIPLDMTTPQRTDAAMRFWRFAMNRRPLKPPCLFKRRDRLIDALRALDGRQSGASYRMIAEGLFGPNRSSSEPWKTASLRDTVIRLVRTGYALMRGDYRHLLGPRRPD